MYKRQIEEFLEYCSQSQVLGDERLSINEVENSDDIFSKDLAKIKTWFIDDQNLKKLVAVTTSRYKLKNKAHPLSQIKAMINLPGSIYGQWKDGKGVIGVSPEPLFVKEKNGWRTRSLAGTISTDESQYKQKLLGDPKEKNEHDLVISDIVHKMKPFAKTIKTGSTTVEAYGKIAHLQTEIFFEAEYLSSEKIVQLLSPTAALGGYPQSLSQRYLQDLGYFNEAGENRYFGGVMGLDFEDESFGLVGIRNFYWDHHQQQGIIHSGCGVVRQSDPQLELLEVKKKRNVITRLFDQ